MLIIELAGLPGCGKSTLWELLKRELQKKGRNVYTYRELMHREPLFVNMGFLFALQKWNPQTISCMKWIEKYCDSLPMDNKREGFKQMFKELYYRVHVAAWRSGGDILLLDEGLIQNFTSLFFMDTIPQSLLTGNMIKNIIAVRCRYLFVKCNISIEESILRLKKRARTNDRYNSLGEEVLRDALMVKSQNIDYVLSFVKSTKGEIVDINMEYSTKSNADLIINKLCL